MSLSEFPDILLLVILHFDGNISDGSLCIEVPLIRRCYQFSLLPFLEIAYTSVLVKALSP